ncbi:EAL domain-containing protein [Lysobacter fragariae]
MDWLGGNRHRWERNALLAAACACLFWIDIPYRASFFGVTANASLAHLHVGLLLAVAMLARDPWALRGCFIALMMMWCGKTWLGGRLAWPQALEGPLLYLCVYPVMRWTTHRMGWPRNALAQPFRAADLGRFLAFGAVLLPTVWMLLNTLTELLLETSSSMGNLQLQVFFAKFFGITILTLPTVILAGHASRLRVPAWRTPVPWRLIVVGVLLPTVLVWALGWVGLDVDAWLSALLDYRLLLAVALVLAVLYLDPRHSMPLLVAVQLLFATALAHHVSGSTRLPDVADMFRIAAECLMLEALVVVLFLHSRERDAAAAQHERDSLLEPLTGLPNLAALRKRAETPLPSLGFLLLDRTERLTAALGLRAEAKLMRAVARQLHGLAHAYHAGTGRLALTLEGDAGRNLDRQWDAVLARLHAFEFSWSGQRVRVLPYLGITGPETGSDRLDARLRHAANAAYDAQQRGELRQHDPQTMHADMGSAPSHQGALQLSSTVLSLIRAGRIELHFQHVVPLAAQVEGELLAGEVLCRLRDDRGLLLYPGEFIAELQADRRMAELDLAVISELDRWLAAHRERLPKRCRISVNVAGQSLASREFAQKLLAALDNFAIPLRMLCIEITETAAITHIPDSMRLLMQLRERGCGIALDDFGVGYQSFERLKQLPATVVKIDGSFVSRMVHSAHDYALVEASVRAARAFGAATVAEFVEDAMTAEALRELGVDWAQGYHYGRPMPIDSLLD